MIVSKQHPTIVHFAYRVIILWQTIYLMCKNTLKGDKSFDGRWQVFALGPTTMTSLTCQCTTCGPGRYVGQFVNECVDNIFEIHD